MKKTSFAIVRTGILMILTILLLSSKSQISFFEQTFSYFKEEFYLKNQAFLTSSNGSNTTFKRVSNASNCTNLATDAIGGLVWEDFNFDGDISTESREFGVANIEVIIYNTANKVVASTTTDGNGQYLFPNLSDAAYRVEFNIPKELKNYTKATIAGTTSQTTVQFVTPGNCANLGLGNPSRYCDATPHLITPCYISGEPTSGGTAGNGEVLVSYPYAAGASKSDVNILSVNREIGSTWGIAYARTSQNVYAAAMLKRHAGFGPMGIGGIYRVNHADPSNPIIEEWMDLAAEGVNIGSNPRNYLLPARPDTSSHDPEAFDAIGKIGLGDMDISEDEKTLYVLNLNNNGSIVAIDIESKTVSNTIPIPNPTMGCGVPEDLRPWALSIYKGAIYVGFVCSGQVAGGGDMQFFVQKYDGNSFTTVLNESLNYTKGFVHASYNKTGPPEICKNWETWISDFNDLHTAGITASGPRWCRPQPILSDIEFDIDGSMMLAFMDRTGHQTGYSQATTDPSDATLGHGYVGGDLLRAFNNNGTYVLENGGKTLDGLGAGLNNLPGSVNGDTIIQGPGGGEFYSGEFFSHLHQETVLGGITFSQNDNSVAVNVMDPENYFSGGTAWLSNITGEKERAFTLYISHPSLSPTPQVGSFGKAAGLGDLELACAAAPIEIGNYVWHDVNADGIQNPNEAGIDDVTIELIKDGVTIATTTTQNGGQYYFNQDGTSNQNWETPGDKVLPNMEYCLRIALTDAALEERAPTAANADETPNGDVRDNDAESIDGYAKITFTTGSPGTNAHEYDFGFTSTICLGGYVWQDKNSDGAQNDSEIGLPSVGVELIKNSVVVATTITNEAGLYFFTTDGAPNQNWTTIGDKVAPEMSYTIRLLHDQDNLAKHHLTEQNKTTDLKDSDGEIVGSYAVINLTSGKVGTSQHNHDFGFQPTLCVGNLVWFDRNNNGIANTTEEGIAGVELILYQVGGDGTKGIGNDVEIARDITDDNGHYLFDDLPEGVYYIKVNNGIPHNMVSTLGTGTNGTNPSTHEPGFVTSTDINNDDNGTQMGNMVMSDTFTLAICTEPINDDENNPSVNPILDPNTNLTVDFGFIPCLSIGNLVWNDINNNGLYENSEPTLEGIEVQLYKVGITGQKNDNDVLVGSQTTEADGLYRFDELKPGNYYVKLNSGIPTGMVSSTGQGPVLELSTGSTEPAANPNNNQNNNDDGTQMGNMIMSEVVNLGIEEEPTNDGDDHNNTNLSIDFGLYRFICLGDYVWVDKNDNGIQDEDEKGIEGVTVELIKNNAVVATTTTNNEGLYFFTLDGAPNQNWRTPNDRVLANMPYTIRIALQQTALENHLIADNNQADEEKDSDGMLNGNYATIQLTSGIEGSRTHQYDFGFVPALSVGNLVWLDDNNNGLFDNLEKGIAGVELILYQVGEDGTKDIGNDIEIDRTQTDKKGNYLFDYLPEGIYYIKINSGIPDNLTSSLGTGKNGANPSTYEPGFVTSTDINHDDNGTQMGNMVMSDTFTLAICTEPTNDDENNPNQDPILDPNTNLTVDFGFIPCLSIGNLVWNDINNNGTADPSEPGFPKIQVILYQTGPDGIKSDDDVEINRMATDTKGYYYFDNLKPGSYYIKLTDIPTPFISSNGEGMIDLVGNGTFEPGAITNNDVNNDDNGSQMGNMVMSDLVQLELDEEPITDGDFDSKTNMSVDFGLLKNHQIKIHNPCTCLNNASSPSAQDGQFSETVTILSNQDQQTWQVKSVTGAYFDDNTLIPVGAIAKENGTEDGQYRYTFDLRHVDGQGYTICFTNGMDDLTVSNLCNSDQSCHYTSSPACN
ncbi:MAG: SdrD B-like domain-containing protein, partial [Saprospiraceae bacterium]